MSCPSADPRRRIAPHGPKRQSAAPSRQSRPKPSAAQTAAPPSVDALSAWVPFWPAWPARTRILSRSAVDPSALHAHCRLDRCDSDAWHRERQSYTEWAIGVRRDRASHPKGGSIEVGEAARRPGRALIMARMVTCAVGQPSRRPRLICLTCADVTSAPAAASAGTGRPQGPDHPASPRSGRDARGLAWRAAGTCRRPGRRPGREWLAAASRAARRIRAVANHRCGEGEEGYALRDFGLDAFLPRRHTVVRSRNPRWRITGND